MNVINLSRSSCKDCYKCLMHCPVKAIKMNKEHHVEIAQDRCISCGRCIVICPQNARKIESDIEKVKNAIKQNKKMIVSIAPSFVGAFNIPDEGQIVSALKQLGFDIIEETAVGAEIVMHLYKEYAQKNEHENLITTSCPSVNLLIERYFPSLIKYMIPVVSPMIAHGKMLKQIYGNDSFVVFIGPCISKKYEANEIQHEDIIDSVITFEELSLLFEEKNINLQKLKPEPFNKKTFKCGTSFPVVGKITDSFKECTNNPYEMISVNGIEECIEIFNALSNKDLSHVCIEANACKGGCINGPLMPKNGDSFYKRRERVMNYIANKKSITSAYDNIDYTHYDESLNKITFKKIFSDKSIPRKIASESDIKRIFKQMGKYEPSDELNCGGCGYNTCREKAQAVFEGMSEPGLCLPFLRSKAERLTNVIFGNSPNAIMILDENLNIIELNPSAEKIFKIKYEHIKNKPVSLIIDDDIFYKVIKSKQNILSNKVFYPQYDVVLVQDILYLEKQNVILAIMNNVTLHEKSKSQLKKVKENTLNAAQEVIENQMRVAQEIASLLGETTAETKVILTKLKKISMEEAGEI